MALTVALWVIAGEIAVAVVVLVVAFLKFSKNTEKTLDETQSLVKSLEERVNSIGEKIEETTSNAAEATVHLKKTLHNTEKATSFLNAILPVVSLVLLIRGISVPFSANVSLSGKNEKRSSVSSTLMNIGKWLAVLQQGMSLYKTYAKRKGGKSNGRK